MESLVRIQELEEKLQLLEAQNQKLRKEISRNFVKDTTLFHNLFMHMNEACVIYKAIDDGADFLISDANPSFEKIENIKKSDFVGSLVSVELKEMSPDFLSVLKRVYLTGNAENYIHQYKDSEQKNQRRNNYIVKLGSDHVASIYVNDTKLLNKELEIGNIEARYKALSDAANEAVFFMVDERCVEANRSGLEMFGFTREEAIGKHALTIIDEEYHEETIQKLKTNYLKPYLSVGVHKSGRRFPIQIHGRLFEYNGKSTRITTMRDVSSQQEKERELLNSEARYKALADAATEAVFIMENGKCIDLNEKAIEIYGYSYDEAIGIPVLDLIAPESRELVEQKFVMEYAEPYEGLCIRKNGEIFPAELRGKNFEYADRKVRISTIRDISAQKQAEIKLSKSEAKFRSYFENHKAIKLQIDVETKQIVDANKAAVDFYGYSKEELLSKTIFDLNALPKEKVLELMEKAKSGEKNSFGFPHRLKNGQLRDVKVYTTIIEVEGREYFFSIMHDVTEARKIEEELKRSEARFRAYFENNTAAMLQIDPKSKQILESNHAALRFYGYSCEQLKKLKIYDINILPPEVIDKKMKEVMASPAQTFIFNHRLASGESKEVEVYVSPIITQSDSQLFITVYDVSEREANKRALEESERKLINAQRIAKVGFWGYTFRGETMEWSAELNNIFEVPNDFINTPENYDALIHPEDLVEVQKDWEQSINDKRKYFSVHRIITPSGKIKYVEEIGYTVYDDNGKATHSFGTTQDITERKRVEIELTKSKSFLDEAQRIAKVGHFEFNLINKKANWSDEICRIFGFDIENKKPSFEKYRKQMHPDDIERQYEIFNRALKERRGYTVTYRIKSKSGEEKQIEEKGYFELDKSGVPYKVIGTMQDITANFLVKKALEESKAQLAQINKNLEKRVKEELKKSRDKDHLLIQQSRSAVLGEMIGNIAHQWRQPLNEVGLLINDLEDAYSFGVLNKDYFEKTTEIVYRRLKFMSETIDDFSKMHTDDFKEEVFSPKKLIEKLIQFTEGTMKKNMIQVRFMCTENFETHGYPNMLSHTLMNLLNNSRDILIDRSIKKPKIWIKLEKSDSNYSIRVLDNGKGVDRDVIDKIFDPYFTTKDKKRGSGLGLYMTKSMVEKQMHGQIQVQNQRNGAEFKVTLNLKNEEV